MKIVRKNSQLGYDELKNRYFYSRKEKYSAMINRLLSKMSGLTLLTALYGTTATPGPSYLHGQTIRIGAVRYRKCVNIFAGGEGLWLQVKIPLWKTRTVLIPWNDISQAGYTSIWMIPAFTVVVGGEKPVTIALPMSIFTWVEPFIRDQHDERENENKSLSQADHDEQ